jgi:hypothetical protein
MVYSISMKRWFEYLQTLALISAAGLTVFAAEEKDDRIPIRVNIDSRVELISIVFRLAGNPEYTQGRVPNYLRDIDEHFGPFRDHALIKLAARLRNTRGVSYDAPMSLAVHLADAERLEERIPFDAQPLGLDKRWRLEELREFLTLSRQFVKETRFAEFQKAHQSLFDQTVIRAEDLLKREARLEWFNQFFGARPNADFNVVLGMVNGGCCYGSRIAFKDREELYCILGVWLCDTNGIPRFDRTVLDTVTHEFGHSYVNPLVYRYTQELEAPGKKLFTQVKSRMQRMAYGNWETMIHESIVRAAVVSYLRSTQGEAAASQQTAREIRNGFLWMEELVRTLGDYEKQRDRHPTLDTFFPKIIQFFKDYSLKSTPQAGSS